MLKALKGIKKRLGSSAKLHEQAAGDSGTAPAGGAPAAAAGAGAAAHPAVAGLPPRPASAPAATSFSHQGPAAVQPAAPAPPLEQQVLAAAVDQQALLPHLQQHEAVDYELVVGALELDSDAGPAVLVGGGGGGSDAEAGAVAGAADHCYLTHHAQQQHPEQVCYGAVDVAGGSSAEEAATIAAAAEAEAALQEGGAALAAAHGGEGDADVGGHDAAGGSCDGAAADAAGGAAGAGGGEAGAADVTNISEALATMMYLTEDAEGQADCVSVVSDARSDGGGGEEDDLPDDISELSRALEALEGEALHGSSPGALSGGGASSMLDDQMAEKLGFSPDAADPAAFSQQMAKLYNNLGLKMMERRKHDQALGLLRKAEAFVDNDAVWAGQAERRRRMQAITYNNLGCLFKRRNMPQLALQYLEKALALEEGGGQVQNSSSTHLNICAAYSALKRPKEALTHAERAIILLQRHLWPHHLNFQEGLASLSRQLAAPGAAASSAGRHLLASANVLAMAYHNAAVEHEKLGRLREGLVSFTRAYLIASKCLGHKAQMTLSLSRALKAFQHRQARHLPTGAASAVRKAPTLASSRAAAAGDKSKRSHARGASKAASSSKLAASSSKGVLAAAASGKATLPLDKGRTTAGSAAPSASGSMASIRPPSTSRLTSQLRQQP